MKVQYQWYLDKIGLKYELVEVSQLTELVADCPDTVFIVDEYHGLVK
jgi:hypothetical protein